MRCVGCRDLKMAKLTTKQELFVREYAVDMNGAAAARRAGFSARSAKITAAKLLTKAHIREAVDEVKKKALSNAEVTLQRVVREIANMAFASWHDLAELIPPGPIRERILATPPANLAVIESMEFPVPPSWTMPEEFKKLKRDAEMVLKNGKFKMTLRKMVPLDMLMRHLNGYKDSLPVAVDPVREVIDMVALRDPEKQAETEAINAGRGFDELERQ